MKAMVLCAGYGTRLGHLVEEIPKPMLTIGGRPMLEYVLLHLAHHGFREIAINLHFRGDVICDYFGDGSRLGIQITYSEEPHLLGTAGSVKKMQPFLAGPDPFLVQYGDVVTDADLTAMLQFHRERRALATLMLHQRQRSNSVVGLDAEGRIVAFLERPTDQERTFASPWVNSGIAICEPALLDAIPAGTACDLPRDIYTKLVPDGHLFGFPLTGRRYAVDSPERLEELRTAIENGMMTQ